MFNKIKQFIQFLEDLKLFKEYLKYKQDMDFWFDAIGDSVVAIKTKSLFEAFKRIEDSMNTEFKDLRLVLDGNWNDPAVKWDVFNQFTQHYARNRYLVYKTGSK